MTSVSAGPPWGGLYLKPPSPGGLCDGVTTMPSAVPRPPPRLWVRIACEITGVGVAPSSASSTTSTPWAASTSTIVRVAGSDSACVSRPRNSGPSMPAAARWRATASEIASTCASLNVQAVDVPRWPEVPNDTRWVSSEGSGRWSW